MQNRDVEMSRIFDDLCRYRAFQCVAFLKSLGLITPEEFDGFSANFRSAIMKVAVSVPGPIFEAVERLAKQRQVPRTQLFADALQEDVSRHGADAATAKRNEVYASEGSSVDRSLARAQLSAIDHEAW